MMDEHVFPEPGDSESLKNRDGAASNACPFEPSETPDAEFAVLMSQIRNGSEEAVGQFVRDYGPHVLRVVRRGLNRKLRSKFDSIDFVQAVWVSLFEKRQRFEQFEDPNHLFGFLAIMARNKVVGEFRRRLTTAKFNVDREELSINDSTVRDSSVLSSPGPTPSQVAVANERWQHMLEDTPERHRGVLTSRIAGASFRDAAEEAGIDERTARRVMEKLVAKASYPRVSENRQEPGNG